MPEDNATPTPINIPMDGNPAPIISDSTVPTTPSMDTSYNIPSPAPNYPMPTPAIADVPSPDGTSIPSDAPSTADALDAFPTTDSTKEPMPAIYSEVINKINESRNVLIALSRDPSVDEMAAAIGLSLYLDRLGKRATAIYSGATPNALEFLKPEETFEPSADTLQDFVIALNKDKADHLRYKLDGSFVKIFITPYRTRLSEDDLEYSYGDYNVDLVLALDVANGIDLDSALREHGRIMHDASIINITTGNPGKFGEIEWSDKGASSISEMIAKLLYTVDGDAKIEKDDATAFLTGIVAATNRFSNAKTTPETMKVASTLMEFGANQQLISKNITPDIENEIITLSSESSKSKGNKPTDPTKLDIEHKDESNENDNANVESKDDKEVETTVTSKEHTLLDDLKAAEASLAQAGAETIPEENEKPFKMDSSDMPSTGETVPEKGNNLPESLPPVSPEIIPESASTETSKSNNLPEQSDQITKINDELNSGNKDDVEKYGHMLENALNSTSSADTTKEEPVFSTPSASENPASASTPAVPTQPEINGVPEINYESLSNDAVLPPPPAPPIEPAMPIPEPTPESLGPQPAMQDQVYTPQASDPGAFKIPGM